MSSLTMCLMLTALLVGCKDNDAIYADINNPEAEFDLKGGLVPVDVMMNVSSVHQTDNTRLTDAVTLLDGTSVRRVNAFYLIPYKVQGEIKVTDTPEQELVDEGASYVDQTNYHYYGETYSIPNGVFPVLWPCRCCFDRQGGEWLHHYPQPEQSYADERYLFRSRPHI